MELMEGLHLSDDLAARGSGMKDLQEKRPESAGDRVEALTLGAAGEQGVGEDTGKALFELAQRQGPDESAGLGRAAACWSQAWPEGREEGSKFAHEAVDIPPY